MAKSFNEDAIANGVLVPTVLLTLILLLSDFYLCWIGLGCHTKSDSAVSDIYRKAFLQSVQAI